MVCNAKNFGHVSSCLNQSRPPRLFAKTVYIIYFIYIVYMIYIVYSIYTI
ncbi:hypothetical protein GJA_5265 [Janthinobacterium agaricidamnosum NBRC 102515 = DSM 9628]|uniref:Uncharacterized protein n=1 Tax=Janthinobacterium agaricidamnosum NBRC 102515 = DSM 9628 TaxID=1349767 RepID=W0VD75_9BURK|nr:hypothetical protein GJA_5265 [Janthinobacterium agaricidamnosum NBRC 102515 = DSM 9628]